MKPSLLACVTILITGCQHRRNPDAIDLDTALKNTLRGEYSLIAVSDAGGAGFVSFQKSWDHKRQYDFELKERHAVRAKVAHAIRKARQRGHRIATMGGNDFFEEE